MIRKPLGIIPRGLGIGECLGMGTYIPTGESWEQLEIDQVNA